MARVSPVTLKECKTAVKWLFLGSGVLFWVAIPMRFQSDARVQDASPPRAVRTLSDFLAWHPGPGEVFRVTVRGSTYYLLGGDEVYPLNSGPSAYTFDANGNYVDWTPDSGDVLHPAITLTGRAPHERTTIEDIEKEIEAHLAQIKAANGPTQRGPDS
jgi:hypothetical protein